MKRLLICLILITTMLSIVACTKVDLEDVEDIMENQIEDIISKNADTYYNDKDKFNSLDQRGKSIAITVSNTEKNTDISVELTEEDNSYQAVISFAEELIYENQFNTAKYTIKIDKKEKFKDLDVEELLFSDKIEVIDLTRYYWSGSVADIDFDNESLKEMLYQNLGYAEYDYN